MQHTILFTIIPRGIALNTDTLPVSVVVSPRLSDGNILKQFPDWQNWTERIKTEGMAFTIQCQNKVQTFKAPTEGLQPELWERLFNEQTRVNPFKFQDYRDRGAYSYSVRRVMSALKETYQLAAVFLGLPEDNFLGGKRDIGRRYLLQNLIKDYGVRWDERKAVTGLKQFRQSVGRDKDTYARSSPFIQSDKLAEDGAIKPGLNTDKNNLATEFSNFHRQPQSKNYQELKKNQPDYENLFDFHQAISAINNYPALQRALGLVFDLELPLDFVAPTTTADGEVLRMQAVQPGWHWEINPDIPDLGTAYWYLKSDEAGIFTTAPANNGSFDMLGLLNLVENQYGIAQIDVDGGMQKMIFLSESVTAINQPDEAKHPEIFDNANTVASLRSGGMSLFADARALRMLARFQQSAGLEERLTSRKLLPFRLQDLVKGYRIDILDDATQQWHSLHQRHETYTIGEEDRALTFTADNQEGLVQLSATRSTAEGAGDELYLHESIMRWAGWSLSVPLPGIVLNSDADPAKALEEEAKNPAVTPFKLRPEFKVVPGSLPALRFGRSYALRARVVDLAGNSLGLKDQVADFFALFMGIPKADKRFPYLRFEPVDAPLVVMRDERALTNPGADLLRIVIRSFNDGIDNDGIAAELTANDRLILPPRTSVEMAERLGMLDDENGKLRSDEGMYTLLAQRDGAELNTVELMVAGNLKKAPIETAETMSGVPYIPDGLSHGAALRNLPGVQVKGIGRVAPGVDPEAPVHYEPIADANPRPGNATLISFDDGSGNWQNVLPFRIALSDGNSGPHWDAARRLLTIFLPKGTVHVSPLSSYMLPKDLEKMGQWKWMKEFIETMTAENPQEATLDMGLSIDRIQHILQRTVEGGHWMLTPPQLITFVHAVQQPIGIPAFEQILAQRAEQKELQILLEINNGPVKNPETNILTSWRALGSPDAYLIGGLRLHIPSTAKVDLYANWCDPVDDLSKDKPDARNHAAFVDEIPLHEKAEGVIFRDGRPVAYMIPNENLLAFSLEGDELGSDTAAGRSVYTTAAPLHQINDTRHHHIQYTPIASSRFKEYFEDKSLDFTRVGESVSVHVPASARPIAPEILYVIPTFGWQRQTETDVKRSVRFGGGLRIYLNRPWYSSGDGELLGVLSTFVDTDDAKAITAWKPFATQWGQDPIWQEANELRYFPNRNNFKDSVAAEYNLPLEETTAPGTVDVSGYTPVFDETRKLWYCDITVDSDNTYMPFIRLALARYQPYALQSVKLSRVVTADFIQLLPNRSLVIIPDAYRKNNFRFNLSGPAPDDPQRRLSTRPTAPLVGPLELKVWMQQYNPAIPGDLGWEDVSAETADISVNDPVAVLDQPGIKLWQGTVRFNRRMADTRYRLVFEEREYFDGDLVATGPNTVNYPSRVVYLETLEI